jgi:CBS domain containing-hemolysin-like protein
MLDEFRQGRAHMAMIVDEFGTIIGMVTVEDVLNRSSARSKTSTTEGRAPHRGRRGRPGRRHRIRDMESEYGIQIPPGRRLRNPRRIPALQDW